MYILCIFVSPTNNHISVIYNYYMYIIKIVYMLYVNNNNNYGYYLLICFVIE